MDASAEKEDIFEQHLDFESSSGESYDDELDVADTHWETKISKEANKLNIPGNITVTCLL
jgi:hypothetical protein